MDSLTEAVEGFEEVACGARVIVPDYFPYSCFAKLFVQVLESPSHHIVAAVTTILGKLEPKQLNCSCDNTLDTNSINRKSGAGLQDSNNI